MAGTHGPRPLARAALAILACGAWLSATGESAQLSVDAQGRLVDANGGAVAAGPAARDIPAAPVELDVYAGGGNGRVIEAGAPADARGPAAGGEEPVPRRGPPVLGPAVELITGGNASDGTARVGRLPVMQ